MNMLVMHWWLRGGSCYCSRFEARRQRLPTRRPGAPSFLLAVLQRLALGQPKLRTSSL